jgi:hypothetical protein
MIADVRHTEGDVPGFVLCGQAAYGGSNGIGRDSFEEPEQ